MDIGRLQIQMNTQLLRMPISGGQERSQDLWSRWKRPWTKNDRGQYIAGAWPHSSLKRITETATRMMTMMRCLATAAAEIDANRCYWKRIAHDSSRCRLLHIYRRLCRSVCLCTCLWQCRPTCFSVWLPAYLTACLWLLLPFALSLCIDNAYICLPIWDRVREGVRVTERERQRDRDSQRDWERQRET